MIRLEHVTKSYDDKPAVDDLSFRVEKGEICVLIGPSGCGKTTTLRMINRLIEPTSGKIWVNNAEISNSKPEQLRRSIGYAIQSVGLFPHMTVAANIAVVPKLLKWDKARISERGDELLKLVGLDPAKYGAKYPKQLSGGEAQRIGVARALAADPPVLLMDEPFGAVDPLTRQRLQSQFLQIQRQLKKTIILVTHDLEEAIRLADRIAVMQAGKLVQHDTPEAILAKPVNKFVHDFVGVDRALKRLSRIGVANFIRPAPAVKETTDPQSVMKAFDGRRSVWVVDTENRPIGWIDRVGMNGYTSAAEVMVRVDLAEMSVTANDTLREALSKMLGMGFKSLPAVDEQGRFLGEMTLAEIEAATADVEKTNHV